MPKLDVLSAAIKIAKAKANIGVTDNLFQKERMDICVKCDKYLKNNKCAVCGCYLQFKTKLKSEVCPLGKW